MAIHYLPSTILPLFLFLFFLYKWLTATNSTLGKKLPPSPPKFPIIGNLHQVGKYPLRSLKSLSQKYGELMLLHLGSNPAIVISSANMASQVMKTYDTAFCGRPKLAIARHLLYNCKDVIFGTYGESWRQIRSICMLQILTNKRVRSFRRVREEELALMIENIKKSSVVNLSEMFAALANDIVCKAAFGRKHGGDEGSVDFGKLLKDLTGILGENNVEDVLPWMAWINWFNGVFATMNKLGRVFDDLVETIIQEHANRVKDTRYDIDDNETTTHFVDILLEVQKNNNTKSVSIDKEVIKGVILDVFIAGTHTNYLTLEWTFTEILRHPKVMKRLQQEVRGITGDKEAVEEEDLEKMTYLKAVIKESLRFHPPLPLPLPRECIEEVKLNGYDIAVGTQVIFNISAIGRDPTYWEEPDNFIPERFLNSPIDYRGQHFELIPFGSGRRGCPGISFAIANVEIVLANLIHQFNWSLPSGGEKESLDNSESPGSFPHKKTPLLVVATPRIK